MRCAPADHPRASGRRGRSVRAVDAPGRDLDATLGVQPASIYLLAVVVAAIAAGTWAAVVASLASFLAFDFLFVEPRFTLTIRDPEEWLNLVVFLFVALVAGRLTALQVERADEATGARAEAATMFQMSRLLGTAPRVAEPPRSVLAPAPRARGGRPPVAGHRSRSRPGAGGRGHEPSAPRRVPPSLVVLRRTPGDRPAEWVRVHEPRPRREPAGEGMTVLRIAIEADGHPSAPCGRSGEGAAGLPGAPSVACSRPLPTRSGQSLAVTGWSKRRPRRRDRPPER